MSRYFNISIFFNNTSAQIFTWLNREYADVRWEHVSAAAECPPTIRPVSELHRDEKSPSVTSLACSSSRNPPFVTFQKGTNNTARLVPGVCPALSLFLPNEKKKQPEGCLVLILQKTCRRVNSTSVSEDIKVFTVCKIWDLLHLESCV